MDLLFAFCVLALGVGFLAALSWKWTIPGAKAAGLIAVGVVLGAVVAKEGRLLPGPTWLLPPAVWAAQLCGYLAALAWLFYRDPERALPPNAAGHVLSPADGEVIYIRKLVPGQIPIAEKKGKLLLLDDLGQSPLVAQELWQIGISMVFTDVHVNRAPIAGTVTLVNHRPGKFLSLRDPDAAGVNERQTLVIESDHVQVGLVQIASRLVRRIVSYVARGEVIPAGRRVGMIKFGSQVDLFVPVEQCPVLLVKLGDRLTAGVTLVGAILAPTARPIRV
jgi:phosphatidylserine decarboxylase